MNRRPFFKFPAFALVSVLMAYLAFIGLMLLPALVMRIEFPKGGAGFAIQLFHASADERLGILCIGCGIAGLLRIPPRHPRYARRYAAWLMATPWRSAIDLPLGPINLVWEDLLLLVPVAMVARWDSGASPLLPVAAFLVIYSVVAIGSLRDRSVAWFGFAGLFLWSLPLLADDAVWCLGAVLAAVCILSHWALTRSVLGFPWDLPDTLRDQKKQPRAGLAWPMDRVGPAKPRRIFPTGVGWGVAAVCGWVMFVIITLNARDSLRDARELVSDIPFICLFAAIARVAIYCLFYWPPIGWWGRVMTGRWVIPGYDLVFVSPVMMCVAAAVLYELFTAAHVPLAIDGGITTAVVSAIAVNGGPSLHRWQLTGHHRQIPSSRPDPQAGKGRGRNWTV